MMVKLTIIIKKEIFHSIIIRIIIDIVIIIIQIVISTFSQIILISKKIIENDQMILIPLYFIYKEWKMF